MPVVTLTLVNARQRRLLRVMTAMCCEAVLSVDQYRLKKRTGGFQTDNSLLLQHNKMLE